jgi:AcrR family transcriptional regulator
MGYVETGRTHQKRRTRDALIDAARALVDDGATPTVEEAASAAQISRTTAYRYFPSQRHLLAAAYPETEATSLLPPDVSDDPATRLASVVEILTDLVVQREAQYRTMLRLSLEATPEERAKLLLRQGRAIGWIEDALSPLRGRLAPDRVHRLAVAVRATTGIEAYVWLRDIARLSAEDAVAIMRWSATALLRQTIAESGLD